MAKQTWDVEPNGRGGWKVQREGASRASSHHALKQEAIQRGRELAQRIPDGQLRIKGGDGQVQDGRSYGAGARGRSRSSSR